MKCKQGDIAIVLGRSVHAGKLVEVISPAPLCDFTLPNSVEHYRSTPGRWVIKSLGSPFYYSLGDGMYGTGTDHMLQPLSGETEVSKLEFTNEISA